MSDGRRDTFNSNKKENNEAVGDHQPYPQGISDLPSSFVNMANPQRENGFTAIANEIVDQFCKHRLSGEEWLVLWVVLRKTYGWNKKDDVISLSQFCVATGLKRSSVVRAINKLVTKRLLHGNQKATSFGNRYRFNKDFSSWASVTKQLPRGFAGNQIVNLGSNQKATYKRHYYKRKKSSHKDLNRIQNKDSISNSNKNIYNRHLEFVMLTDNEYSSLTSRFGKKNVKSYIESLNDYIGSKGKKYKSHYYTLRNWLRRDGKTAPPTVQEPKIIVPEPTKQDLKRIKDMVKNVANKCKA